MPRKFKRRVAKKPLGKRQARAVQSIAEKTVQKMAEHKYVLATASAISMPDTGSLMSIHGTISQNPGDEANRIGDEIMIGSLRMRFQLHTNSLGAARQNFRVVAFQFFNADTPTVGDVLDPDAPNFVRASYNTQGQSQGYKILYDKTVTLNHEIAATSMSSKVFNVKLRPGRRKLKYADNSSTAARNGIWFIFVSDVATASNPPTYDAHSRLNFIDL